MQRRRFLKSSALAATVALTPDLACAALQAEDQAGAMPQKEYRPLTGPFRLSQDWHRATLGRFQEKLAALKLDAAVVTGPDNINYLTGAFAITTERPIWLVVPAKGEPAVFHPGLDRDLWQTWWLKDLQWYFDFPHHGGFGEVMWNAGPQANLLAWVLDGMAKRGWGKARVGFESRVSDAEARDIARRGMKPEWESVGKTLLSMRMVKTAEELALCRQGIALHDRMMDFARDYILANGAAATDFEVAHATQAFGASELVKYLKLDGRPHTAVGVDVGFSCRTGIGTAYPHPNQFFYSRVQRGDALQIAAGVRIGGYGGEGYRAMQIDGPNVGDLHRKMWEVHTAMTLKQQDLMVAGRKCNQVGEGVLKLAKDAGMEKYVYHRPAHGEGSEGHQAPYLSLGDNTVLEENMTFSNEPGLYSPADGFGYNHSNLVRVTKSGGEQINQTPLTKDWCWIRI